MNYCIIKTNKKGIAVFSNKVFVKDEIIGEYIGVLQNENGRKLYNGMYESAILGRYCNHNSKPNTNLVELETGSIILISNTNINIGDEITTNYLEVERMIGVPYLTYYKEYFTNTSYTDFGNIIN